jgi:hypothetical protein
MSVTSNFAEERKEPRLRPAASVTGHAMPLAGPCCEQHGPPAAEISLSPSSASKMGQPVHCLTNRLEP